MSEVHHVPAGEREVPDDDRVSGRVFHRIAEVRRREGMSLRGISRRLRVEVRQLKQQERGTADLRLSELYRWQRALQVPLSDLLLEDEAPVSAPVIRRAQLIRLMKTVHSIREHAGNVRIQRMAEMLAEQLIEIMPELEGVSGWPSVGQRRTMDDFGLAATRVLGRDLSSELEDGD